MADVVETTYYKDKVYLPREVKEKLGLVDGDRLRVEVADRGVVRLVLIRGSNAVERILKRLDDPPDLGEVKGRITREEIYEDIA